MAEDEARGEDEYTIEEMKQNYYQSVFYLQEYIEKDSHVSTLLELKDLLDNLSFVIAERVKTLKPENNDNEKYTLKQLRQAWAAGRLATQKNQR